MEMPGEGRRRWAGNDEAKLIAKGESFLGRRPAQSSGQLQYDTTAAGSDRSGANTRETHAFHADLQAHLQDYR